MKNKNYKMLFTALMLFVVGIVCAIFVEAAITVRNYSPLTNSYIMGNTSQPFLFNVSHNLTSANLYYKKSADPGYTSVEMTCQNEPTDGSFCNADLDLSSESTYPDGQIINYYFYGTNGTDNVNSGAADASHNATIDRTAPVISSISAFSNVPGRMYVSSSSENGITIYINTVAGEGGDQTITIIVNMQTGNATLQNIDSLAGSATWNVSAQSNNTDSTTLAISYSIPVSAGSNSTLLTVTDKVGRTDTATITWIEDNTPPTVYIFNITESSAYLYQENNTHLWYGDDMPSAQDVVINGTASDSGVGLANVTFPTFFGDSPTISTSSPWEATYTIESNDADTGSLNITAKDRLGNIGTAFIIVARDTTNPTLTVESITDSSPYIYDYSTSKIYFGDDMSSAQSFDISGTASDATGLASISYSTAFGDSPNADTSSPWDAIYTVESTDTNATITITALDVVGNEVQISVEVLQDTSAPTIDSGAWSESSDFMYINNGVLYFSKQMGATAQEAQISGTATDIGGSGLELASFSSEASLASSPANDSSAAAWSGNYTIDNNSTATDSPVIVIVIDKVGNYVTAEYSYAQDTTAPLVSTIYPTSGSIIPGNNSQPFSITADSDLSYAVLYYKNLSEASYSSQQMSCAGTSCSVNLDLSNTGKYADGAQIRYYFQFWDLANNSAYNGTATEYHYLIVDRTAPVLTLVSPTNGSRQIANSVIFNATISDTNPITACRLEWNATGSFVNETMIVASNECYITNATTDGQSYSFNIFAMDVAGNWGLLGNASFLENTKPVITGVAINETTVYFDTAIKCDYTASDDEGDTITPSYKWFNGASEISGETNAILTEGKYKHFDVLRCEVTPNDGYEDGYAVNSTSVVIVSNYAPTVPSQIDITPATAYKSDTLNCAASGSTDADNDTITYYYEFLDNDNSTVLQAWSTTATFDCNAAESCIKADTIYCRAQAFDGTANSLSFIETTRVINNSVPSTTAPTLSPIPAYKTTGIISCSNGTFIDNDPADTPTWYYRWFLNGTLLPNITSYLTNDSFNKYDTIICEVTPEDGTANGTAVNSAALTISNSAPTTPILGAGNPGNGSRQSSNSVTLNCTGSYDADGDTIYYEFYGNPSATEIIPDRLLANTTSDSYTWTTDDATTYYWRCRANDADGGDSEYTSISNFRENQPPIVVSATLTPTTAYANDTLTCVNGTITDAENDTVTLSYQWYNDSGLISGETGINLVGKFSHFDNITCEIIANDAYELSNATNSAPLQISNWLPTPPTMTTNLTLRETDHTPDVNWTAGTDTVDNDPITTIVYVGTTASPTTQEGNNTGTGLAIGSRVTLSDGITYYVRLASWDGYNLSSYSSDYEFQMNALPSTTTPSINPSTPYAFNDLTCTFNVTDAQADTLSVTYIWWNGTEIYTSGTQNVANNTPVAIALGPNIVRKTENWTCQIIPYDTYENGTSKNSSSVSVYNSVIEINSTLPLGTVTNSTPNLVVVTSEYSACKYDTSFKSYNFMTNDMTASSDGMQHTASLGTLNDGTYNYFIACSDTTSNMKEFTISFIVDTDANFNYIQWLIPSWDTLWIPPQTVLENMSYTNFNITTMLSSIGANYSQLFYYNGSSWIGYNKQLQWDLNALRYVNNTNDRPYWIKLANVSVRIRYQI